MSGNCDRCSDVLSPRGEDQAAILPLRHSWVDTVNSGDVLERVKKLDLQSSSAWS